MPKKHSEYSSLVLDHYRNPRNSGKLKHTTHQAEVLNDLCGDEISVSLSIEKNTVKDIRFTSRGCALMTASASLLSERIRKLEPKIIEIKKLKVNDVEKLLETKISKARVQCIELPIKALQRALSKPES